MQTPSTEIFRLLLAALNQTVGILTEIRNNQQPVIARRAAAAAAVRESDLTGQRMDINEDPDSPPIDAPASSYGQRTPPPPSPPPGTYNDNTSAYSAYGNVHERNCRRKPAGSVKRARNAPASPIYSPASSNYDPTNITPYSPYNPVSPARGRSMSPSYCPSSPSYRPTTPPATAEDVEIEIANYSPSNEVTVEIEPAIPQQSEVETAAPAEAPAASSEAKDQAQPIRSLEEYEKDDDGDNDDDGEELPEDLPVSKLTAFVAEQIDESDDDVLTNGMIRGALQIAIMEHNLEREAGYKRTASFLWEQLVQKDNSKALLSELASVICTTLQVEMPENPDEMSEMTKDELFDFMRSIDRAFEDE